MDKNKDNGILLVSDKVLDYCGEVDEMKKFINAEIELISFEMTDIITTSLWADNAGNGEDDKIEY